MAPIAQRARGTQDLMPADQPYWDAMEGAAKEQAGLFRDVYRRQVTLAVRRDGPPPGQHLLSLLPNGHVRHPSA